MMRTLTQLCRWGSMTCEWNVQRSQRIWWTNCTGTGNGLQGFQKPIEVDSFVVDGMGALGSTHTERGLTYFEVALAGHM